MGKLDAVYQSLLLANALPEPDFKYFSNLIALVLSLKQNRELVPTADTVQYIPILQHYASQSVFLDFALSQYKLDQEN